MFRTAPTVVLALGHLGSVLDHLEINFIRNLEGCVIIMMKLQTPARAPRQQTYMGISKKNPNPPTKKLKVPTLQQITKKALNAMLQTPSKVTTPSLISAAERGN